MEADKHIRDLTIITEYVGDVDYLKNRENDDGDSMMTLLTAANPSKSLVICPDKRSNIARFINGINNHIPYVNTPIALLPFTYSNIFLLFVSLDLGSSHHVLHSELIKSDIFLNNRQSNYNNTSQGQNSSS